MVITAAKYAAGAALSILLFTTLAGIEWLPFAGPRQTLQDIYHHHLLEQQDVGDFKAQPVFQVQEAVSAAVNRARRWRPSFRILQGPVVLDPDDTPAPEEAASPTASDASTTSSGGPSGSLGGPASGPGAAAPGAAGPGAAAPGASASPSGCVPIGTSSSSSEDSDSAAGPEAAGPGAAAPGALAGTSAEAAAPAPDGSSPVTGVLCASGSAGGVFVPQG